MAGRPVEHAYRDLGPGRVQIEFSRLDELSDEDLEDFGDDSDDFSDAAVDDESDGTDIDSDDREEDEE